MSWWDSKGFGSLASQALKTAQKQIDKVLDIEEEAGGKGKNKGKSTTTAAPAPKVSTAEPEAPTDEGNSWNTWTSSWMAPKASGGEEEKEAEEKEADTSAAGSSWGFSWGTPSESSSKTASSSSSAATLTSGSSAATPTSKESPVVSTYSSAARKLKLMAGQGKQTEPAIATSTEEESSRVSETTESRSLIHGDDKSNENKNSFAGSRLSPELPAPEDDKDLKVVIDSSEQKDGTSGSESRVSDVCAEEKELSPDDAQTVSAEGRLSETHDIESPDVEQEVVAGAEVDMDTDRAADAAVPTDAVPGFVEGAASPEMGYTEEMLQDRTSDRLSHASVSSEVSQENAAEAECDTSQGVDSSREALSVQDSAFETVLRGSDSRDTMEDSETAPSASSSDTVISRDASLAMISASEDLQAASMTSVSSEPVLLSLSMDDSSDNVTQEEGGEEASQAAGLGPFDPPSHSSVGSEVEVERTCFPGVDQDVGTSQDDRSSSVSSPPLDSAATVSSNDSSDTSRLDSSMDTVVDRSQQLQQDIDDVDVDDSRQHWMEESGLANLEGAGSPSASFVKCMIEDAMGMDDASKHEDSGSDNHSEEKSESSKVDSEFEKSIYSGHESSDEIETTTSSDIEIISTPTPNGEKNIMDLSPLQFSLQRAARGAGPGHHRSDSQSSSSTHSKGDTDYLSPDRDLDHERQWLAEEEDREKDNPQHPQRLLKKLAEMAEVLQARENKLVQLSKDNNDLLETSSILRSQLQQVEESREAEMTDLNALTEEFSRRMGESERKMQSILKEKEAMKQQLQLSQSELAKRAEDTNLEAVLAEKDEQVIELMKEGEKLSKQQLQNSNIIKKLRSKEKENEGLLASQKKKLDQQKEELDRLMVVLDSKEDMEKKQADAIKQLNAAVQAIEKEKVRFKVEVETSEEKIRGLQSTLDNSYKEITELHKSNATQDSRAQQAALSAEMQIREELKMAVEQQTTQHYREKESLVLQVDDLRMSLSRMEKEQNRREEMLKQENSDLQMRLQEGESRSQDLTHSVTSATRPLLRQIENLQATHTIQSSAWEKVESTLIQRLTEAQTLLAMAQEKERGATEKLVEVSSRCTALEASNSQLRTEKAHTAAQLDHDRRRLDMLEERRASDVAQLELAKQKLSEDVASIRKDKVFLEQQLESVRNRLEAEKQRVSVAEEQIRIMERSERPRSRGTPSPVSVSRQDSINSSFSERSSTPTWLGVRQDENEGHLMAAQGPKVSLYDSMRQGGATALIENLHSQLKLREGEITQLQAEIQQLERTRESMARELVNLTNQNEELQDEVKELPKTRSDLQDLDSRYNALLQMYGEKEEQVQELRMDLDDVKEAYKQQINSLMQ